MPQIQLPVFPAGSKEINSDLAFECRDHQVTYFNGHLPVFTHAEDDLVTFRFFTTQLIINGSASQSEIVKAFGVPLTTVKRYTRKYRQAGGPAFFTPPPRRPGTRLNPERLAQAQKLLDEGLEVPAVSRQLGVLATTLHKAIRSGRLQVRKKSPEPEPSPRGSTQAERVVADQEPPLGVATGRTEERVLASVGKLSEVTLQFERCDDVPLGGVLCALPALLAVGLLRHVRQFFPWPKGYYPLESIFVALALLALARVRSLEALRYESPGEWGKLLGLDRIPEVRTMRSKIVVLCQEPAAPAQWGSQLAQDWMAAHAAEGGFYYVDGHVRVYHGAAALRPRAYVAREQLCLRASLDYWVNAMDGQPFFVVTQDLNEKLIQTLQEQIVPRLLAEAPGQPSEAELQADPLLHRFVMVFDREGWSPKLFKDLLEQRIAVVTYAKRCKATEDWPVAEFTQRTVTLRNGEVVSFWMAERRVALSNGLSVREVRHREEGGHQTSIIATDFIHSLEKVAAVLFARWCQENFFRYMMQHYALDRFVEYGAEPIPETSLVVNPQRRSLESQIRRERARLSQEQALLTARAYPAEPSAAQAEDFEKQQGQLLESIHQRQANLVKLKDQRPTTPKKVPLKDLPEAERFTRLPTASKHFVDTIKMIAYRAETALVGVASQKLQRPEDVRSWVRQVLQSSANLIPDEQQRTLTVQVHPLTNAAHNAVLKHLCIQLTETETIYPRTDLRLVFEFLGPA